MALGVQVYLIVTKLAFLLVCPHHLLVCSTNGSHGMKLAVPVAILDMERVLVVLMAMQRAQCQAPQHQDGIGARIPRTGVVLSVGLALLHQSLEQNLK